MTTQEKADAVIEKTRGGSSLVEAIVGAIELAIIEERAACAVACGKLAKVWSGDIEKYKKQRLHRAAMRAEWFAEGAKDCAKAIWSRGS